MKKLILTLLLTLTLSLSLAVGAVASAEEIETPDTATAVADEAPASIFDALSEVIGKYCGEILSAFAFLGSAVVAFSYKKGLFPVLKSGVGRLSDAVCELKENIKEDSENSKGTIENVKNYVQSIANSVEEMEYSIDTFEKRIESIEEKNNRDEALSLLLYEQIELLSDIFLSSSLPQYRKELVAERTANMKKKLTAISSADANAGEGGE